MSNSTDEKVSNLIQLAVSGNDLALGIFKIYNLAIKNPNGQVKSVKQIKDQLRAVCKREDLPFNTMYNGLANKYQAIIAERIM